MAGPRARKVRDWYIIALVSGEVVGYLRREANGFTTPCVGGGAEGAKRGVEKERTIVWILIRTIETAASGKILLIHSDNRSSVKDNCI